MHSTTVSYDVTVVGDAASAIEVEVGPILIATSIVIAETIPAALRKSITGAHPMADTPWTTHLQKIAAAKNPAPSKILVRSAACFGPPSSSARSPGGR